jgi:hypothetical protein
LAAICANQWKSMVGERSWPFRDLGAIGNFG